MKPVTKLCAAVLALFMLSACAITSDKRIMPASAAITPLPRDTIIVAYSDGDQPVLFTLKQQKRSYLLIPPPDKAGLKPFPVTFYPVPGAPGFMILAVEDTTDQKSGFLYTLGKANGDVLDVYLINDAGALSAHGEVVGGKYTGSLKVSTRAGLEGAMRDLAGNPDRLTTVANHYKVFDVARGGKAAADKFLAERMALYRKR